MSSVHGLMDNSLRCFFFFFFIGSIGVLRNTSSSHQELAQAYRESDDTLLVQRSLTAAFHGGNRQNHDPPDEGRCSLVLYSSHHIKVLPLMLLHGVFLFS